MLAPLGVSSLALGRCWVGLWPFGVGFGHDVRGLHPPNDAAVTQFK